MTRTHTFYPTWTWRCDDCGREEHLAVTQQGLPTAEEMRGLGWFIAEKWGDKCPQCYVVRVPW